MMAGAGKDRHLHIINGRAPRVTLMCKKGVSFVPCSDFDCLQRSAKKTEHGYEKFLPALA